MDNSTETEFGGRHVPEKIEAALEELESGFEQAMRTDEFCSKLRFLQSMYSGRPTPLFYAENLSREYGVDIYLKREDLNHGGAHKINNCLGQALLAKQAGKRRLIAETGAGQHGTATAMAGAMLGLDVEIYMGRSDFERQEMNVFRMKLLGATVNEVTQGGADLEAAVDAALEDFAENMEKTHYLVGSAVGPEPFPRMVREFQSVIGEEAREQVQDVYDDFPDACIACVGGGSNAIGLFHAFKDDDVDLLGAEGGGDGVQSQSHAAPLSEKKNVEVLHGMKTRTIGDDVSTHSVSPGLDYPGVGPEHARLQELGEASYYGVTDEEALEAFRELSELEGIIPALESSHAVALAKQVSGEYDSVIINLSGRGDKDMDIAVEKLDL